MAFNTTVTQYYEVITDSTPAVAPGGAISFASNGSQYVGFNPVNLPVRIDNSTFAISGNNGGEQWWRITWQVGLANSGQLVLGYSPGPVYLSQTVVGTSWGHCQVVGDFTIVVPYRTTWRVSLFNPPENQSYLNLLSHGVGNVDVVVSITFEAISY